MTESLFSPPSISNRLSLTRGASAPSISSIAASPSPSGSPVSPVFSPSSPLSPSPSSSLLSPEEELIRKANDRVNKRTKLIAEIHETEKAYTTAISRLVSEYLTPLRHACADYNLKYDHIATIFSNIEQIAGFHSILLTQLPKNATATEVCQAFLKFADFLRMYIPYVNNYSDAIKTLTLVNENKKFYRFCQEKKQSMGLDLMSYLIMPVQRIPRYELLLKELKRNLDPPADPSKPSHESLLLDEALSKIVAVAHQVNEQKRQAERVSALLAIQSRVSHLDAVFPHNTINAEHRRLIKEGDLYKRSTFSKKQRHCYLFNDIFLWCNNNRYKGHVSIVDLKVQGYNEENNSNSKDDSSTNGSNSNGGSGVGDKEGGCGMELIHPAIKTMLLYSETVYERNSWLNAFNEAAEEVKTLDPSIIASLTVSNRQQHERTVSVSSNGAKLTAFNQSDVNSPITPLSPRSPSNIMEEEGEEEETHNTSHTRTHTNTDTAITPTTTTQKAKEEEKETADASSAQTTNSSNSSNTQEEKEVPATAAVPVVTSVVVEKKSPRGLSSTAHSRSISRVLDIKPTHQRNFTHSSAANNNAIGSSSSSSTQSTVSTPSHSKSTLSARSRTHSRKVSVVVTGVNSTTPVLSSPAANSKQKQQQPPPLPTTAPNPQNHTEANTHAPSKSNHKASVEEEPDEQSTVISLPILKLKPLNIASSSSSSIPILRIPAASSPCPSPAPSAPPSSSIASLSRNDITSLKKMKSPPLPVKLAIESLAVLLDLPAGEPLRGEKKPNYWLAVQTLLVKPNFVKVLLDFEHDQHKVSTEGIQKLREYVNDKRLAPELVQVCSPTAAVLWRWVRERFVAQTGETLTVEDGSKNAIRRVSTSQVVAKVDSGATGRSAAAHSKPVSVASTPRGVRQAAFHSNNESPPSGSAATKSTVVHSRQHSVPNAPCQPMQHTVAKEANHATGITVTKTRIAPTPIPTKPAKPAAPPTTASTTRTPASNRSHIGAAKKKIAVFGQMPSYALKRILDYCESPSHKPSPAVLVNHHWLSTSLSRMTQHNQQAIVSLKAAYAQTLEQLKKEGVSSEEGHRLLTIVDTHNTQLIAAAAQIQPNSLKSLKALVKPPPAVLPVFKAILLLLESSTAHKTQQQSQSQSQQQQKNKETVVSTAGGASRDLTMIAHKTVLNHPHLLSWLVTMNASGLYHGLDSQGRSQLVQLIAGCDVAAVEKSCSAAGSFCKWLLCVRACVEWMQQTAHIKTILQLDTQQQQLTDCDRPEMPSTHSSLQPSVQAYLAASAIAHVLLGH